MNTEKGKEITAMQELIEHIKGHYAWFMEHSPDYGVVPKILDKATSLLAKEREQMDKCFDAGKRYGQSSIFGLGVKYEPNFTIYFTTHYSQL